MSQAFYAWTFAIACGYAGSIETLIIGAAFMLGMSFGWANPTGAALRKDWASMNPDNFSGSKGNAYNWWQIGYLRKNPYAALFVRGILWGLPVILAGFLVGSSTVIVGGLSAIVAMPLAVFISAYGPFCSTCFKDTWEQQEFLRGILIGIGTLFIPLNLSLTPVLDTDSLIQTLQQLL